MMHSNPSTLLRRYHQQGFTLLEVMLALLVLVLVSGVLYSSWTTSVKAIQDGTSLTERLQSRRAIMEVVPGALQNIMISPANSRWFPLITTTSAKSPRQDGIEFVTSTPIFPVEHLGGCSVQRTRLSWETIKGKRVLVIAQRNHLADDEKDEWEFEKALPEELAGIRIEYFDSDDETGKPKSEWTETDRLPSAFELTFYWIDPAQSKSQKIEEQTIHVSIFKGQSITASEIKPPKEIPGRSEREKKRRI